MHQLILERFFVCICCESFRRFFNNNLLRWVLVCTFMSHSRPVFYLAPARPHVHVHVHMHTFFLSLPPSPPHFLPPLISRTLLSGHSILLDSLNIAIHA